jgi:hypothetical protein
VNFDLDDYLPRPNNWLQSQLSFEGNATVKFSSPAGEIKGTGRMSLPNLKSMCLEVTVEDLNAEPEYGSGFGLISFLNSEVPVREGNAIVYRPQFDHNPCESVVFQTLEGTFSSQEIGVYGYHTEDGNIILQLHPHNFVFKPNEIKGNPTYWVAPLTNLFTYFPHAPDHLRAHPLRLKAIKEVEQCTDRAEWQWKHLAANDSNRLFYFETETDTFFIEPLNGFETGEKRDQVESHQITAIAVGELTGRTLLNHQQITEWFPFQILAPLSFGTGAGIAIPWFETRNERGDILSQLHVSIGHSGKTRGNQLFTIHHSREGSGLGEFVSRYLKLPEENRRALVAPMNLFLKGTPGSGHVEDNLVDVIRAFENLAKQHGLARIDLSALLTEENLLNIQSVLSNARSEMSALRKRNKENMALDQIRVLEKINSRLANVATSEGDFGLAVVELAKRHGFPDADILDADYIPRIHGKTWAALLSELRGAAIHEGHIEFRERHNIAEVFKLLRHLHDLLARIIFKECRYEGTYQTQLERYTNATSVDWVKPEFNADRLRF